MTYYEIYIQASNALVAAEESLKDLRVRGEQAAMQARKNTTGDVHTKIAAIRAAWLPFTVEIEKVEQSLPLLREEMYEKKEQWVALEF